MLLVNIVFVKQNINQVLFILFTKLVNCTFAGYRWHILGVYQAIFKHFLGISKVHLWNCLGIYCAYSFTYLGHILSIFCKYIGHILVIYRLLLGYNLDMLQSNPELYIVSFPSCTELYFFLLLFLPNFSYFSSNFYLGTSK